MVLCVGLIYDRMAFSSYLTYFDTLMFQTVLLVPLYKQIPHFLSSLTYLPREVYAHVRQWLLCSPRAVMHDVLCAIHRIRKVVGATLDKIVQGRCSLGLCGHVDTHMAINTDIYDALSGIEVDRTCDG